MENLKFKTLSSEDLEKMNGGWKWFGSEVDCTNAVVRSIKGNYAEQVCEERFYWCGINYKTQEKTVTVGQD